MYTEETGRQARGSDGLETASKRRNHIKGRVYKRKIYAFISNMCREAIWLKNDTIFIPESHQVQCQKNQNALEKMRVEMDH